MEKPNVPSPAGDARTPLSFNLSQAAALCGITTQQLCEWTDCGYVRAAGPGERRRFDRDALRQILAVRDAVKAGHAPSRARAARSRAKETSGVPELLRPEEFSVASAVVDDSHLALQTTLFFAMNVTTTHTPARLSDRLGVPREQMQGVLDALVRQGGLASARVHGEAVYYASQATLRGPSPREKRIRARRRFRNASRFSNE